MSALKIPIDYKGLEEDLQMALAADELYRLQNDAKLRAIEQGAPTYEHFRQMVNAAHLKPLDRADMEAKVGVLWNSATSSGSRSRGPSVFTISADSRRTEEKRGGDIETTRPLETCEELAQFWRTTEDCSERFAYLWHLRHALQTRVFRIEIPSSFLGDLMHVCLLHLAKVDDVARITELLGILSRCNRFDLTICFMTKDERSACQRLFRLLRLGESSRDKSEGAIESLAAKYQVELDQ